MKWKFFRFQNRLLPNGGICIYLFIHIITKVNFIYIISVYTITKFKICTCIIYLMVIMYTLTVYIRLIQLTIAKVSVKYIIGKNTRNFPHSLRFDFLFPPLCLSQNCDLVPKSNFDYILAPNCGLRVISKKGRPLI